MVKVIDNGVEYEILSRGESHRCGEFPTPKTFDEYIVCSCGTLYRSEIKRTYCRENPYVYLWEKPTPADIRWSVSQGRLDPKYAPKKKWWELM